MKIPFSKYQGAGNDFILIDLRRNDLLSDPATFARRVCERRFGIGADGLLLLLPSLIANYRLRIFNADGSEPAMCGNGIRCLVDFIYHDEPHLSELTIETLAGILKTRKVNGEIAIHLGCPTVQHWPLEFPDGEVYVMNTGVPHAVIFVDDLDKVDIHVQGRKIRFHPLFFPEGVNVNFASIQSDGNIALRTYERGVEGETLACGTGAAATAYVAFKRFHFKAPISILTCRSFEQKKIQYFPFLRFYFSQNSQGQIEIEMVGPAEKIFEGSLELD